MSSERHIPRGIAVPGGRLSRLGNLGGMAAGVAGNVALTGSRKLLAGERPRIDSLLLTPANVQRITGQLAQMRGAAMKIGQLISMETGELLPPELQQILGHLRADAHFMPPRQLKEVLIRNWGKDFQRGFSYFDVRPMAAASIGQVHRARTKDGRDLAIKVQYPGVRRSIDSDVANVALLMRMSGLLPREIDLTPQLEEARSQLHQEADYAREGRMLSRFGALLADDADYHIPALEQDLSTGDILAMSFAPGVSVDALADASPDIRNRVVGKLIALMLRELFDFRLMQTDPNFANYRYDADTGRIALLDFGATRAFPAPLVQHFLDLFAAGMACQDEEALRIMTRIGYLEKTTKDHHRAAVLNMFNMAMQPLRQGGVLEFATTDLPQKLREAGMEFAMERDFWVIPPMDTLFLQRKMAGMFLLAARLRARVDLDAVLASVPDQTAPRQRVAD